MSNKFLDETGLSTFRDWIKSKLSGKQDALTAGDGITIDNNTISADEVFIAVYEQTSYADVKAAIDAHKAIVLDMPANNNQFCATFSTYTNGGNALMYAIYKINDKLTLMTATLTPTDNWTISHTDLQEKLESGINIKTVNNISLLGRGNINIEGGRDNSALIHVTGWNEYHEALGKITNSLNETIRSEISIRLTDNTEGEATFTIANLQEDFSREINVPATIFVTNRTGFLEFLKTDNKDNLVNAINEVYEKSGEPFRVKNWASNTLNVEIPTCTEDISNTSIPKMVFSIDNVEGADYQIVGMLAYEVFDAASGGNRINCWPVCPFTGNGQKELSVRWMCAGTTRKTAKRINAWVLLKHR
ncbi:MAG: hypothetical protein IKE52_05985 [Mogibacterium sp.]|nr:hypothetical protein [Mogibacterium sp.]